jgi:hypothetical protein
VREVGRRARLIELDPEYVDTIVLRWQAVSGATATMDGDEEIAAGRRPRRRERRGWSAQCFGIEIFALAMLRT